MNTNVYLIFKNNLILNQVNFYEKMNKELLINVDKRILKMINIML